jgi:hypothetical protein
MSIRLDGQGDIERCADSLPTLEHHQGSAIAVGGEHTTVGTPQHMAGNHASADQHRPIS